MAEEGVKKRRMHSLPTHNAASVRCMYMLGYATSWPEPFNIVMLPSDKHCRNCSYCYYGLTVQSRVDEGVDYPG